MRHGKSFNHLGRTAPHRAAMLSNMAISLIMHKRITTTVAKAKALRTFVEPIINRSKVDSTHNRRTIFAHLQDKESIKELFGTVSEKVANRPGGYTRIIKLMARQGDNANMCLIELVDFNELLLGDGKEVKKTRRSRRGSSGASTTAPVAASSISDAVIVEEAPEATAPEDTVAEAAPTLDATVEEAPEASAPEEIAAETAPEVEATAAEAPAAEDAAEASEEAEGTDKEPTA